MYKPIKRITMKLNGKEREVNCYNPDRTFFDKRYEVDVQYACPRHKVHKGGLFYFLEQIGLQYSRLELMAADAGGTVIYGFNDPEVMGAEQAELARTDGRAYLWIGLGVGRVRLDFAYLMSKGLSEKEMPVYAQKVLDKVVAYVENRINYND